jgi:PTS system galactitol-specific IIA component
MADLTFNSSLVIRIEDEGLTCEDVERRIASVLTEQGYAKDSYAQAIVDREKNFPTALDMGG